MVRKHFVLHNTNTTALQRELEAMRMKIIFYFMSTICEEAFIVKIELEGKKKYPKRQEE